MIINWSNVEQFFVVEIPELPGCYAHGKSKLEALENAETAVTLWINNAKVDNIHIPDPKGI